MPFVLHTEIIHTRDTREFFFDEAEHKGFLALVERGTFGIVLADEDGDKPNILISRFVLSIKPNDNEPPILKHG